MKVTLKPGINTIYGESGVGKTSLCHRIASSLPNIKSRNFVLSRITPVQTAMLVMQDPDDQIVAPTVYRELAFNLENEGWESDRIDKQIDKMVELFNLRWNLQRHPSTLSGGERELLNIASAFSVSPDLLVIDDGMAFLSDSKRKMTVKILKEYCQKRGAIVLWATSETADLRHSIQAWELHLDRLTEKVRNGERIPGKWEGAPGKMLFEMDGFSFRYEEMNTLFANQDLTAGPFRALALLGDNGSGKSTLGYLLMGMIKPGKGGVRVVFEDGRKPKMGFLPQNPERTFGGRTLQEVLDDLILSEFYHRGNEPLLMKVLQEFQISWDLVRQDPIHALELSVIRVSLVVLMCTANYDLVILDEPMFSMGRDQRTELIRFIRQALAHRHLIIMSHSNEIAEAVCDESLHIKDGEISRINLKAGKYA